MAACSRPAASPRTRPPASPTSPPALAAIARGAGCPKVSLVNTVYEFMEAAADAFEGDTMATVVAKVEAVGPDHYGMDMKLPENAFRFQRHILERQRVKQPK